MNRSLVTFLAFAVLVGWLAPVFAAAAPETSGDSRLYVPSAFPAVDEQPALADRQVIDIRTAGIWPFGKKDAAPADAKTVVPKSPRKAFFLSMLLPGLGEYYVGAKRGFVFMGVEAVAWWMYMSYTKKGNDLDKEFKQFAETNWRYSAGDSQYSYVEWLAAQMRANDLSDASLPRNYADLAKNPAYMDSITQALIDRSVSGVSHALPSTKTQQYYEMIGKYPQFVYGWADIVGYSTDSQGVKHYFNPSLVDSLGNPKGNYGENLRTVESPMRNHYVDVRYDSNQNLKRGQNGIELMIVNRVISAIDAARLAYHHNKGLESELSMVRVNVVSTHIIDHEVPVLTFTKKF
jgi:hypothetical protein